MENKKLSYTPPVAEIVFLYSEGIICTSGNGSSSGDGSLESGGGNKDTESIW